MWAFSSHLIPVGRDRGRVVGRAALLALSCLVASGCLGNRRSPLPRSPEVWPPAEHLLVWVGAAEAFRWSASEQSWRREPSYDYDFTLVHRRWGRRARAVKTLHRRHPDYSGLAGPRDATLYFEVTFEAGDGGERRVAVQSNLGAGSGVISADGESAHIELGPVTSFWAPFNRVTLTQRFDFSAGRVEEVVALSRRLGSDERPFMKFVERARLLIPGGLAAPPWPAAR